ncbi:unnamed protein product [Urochloa decumbens]|uniref:Uncharacterized protein n=1 Tax=Urochloa decumbens TaxID=240449 RepID=A0ABC9B4I4_9POAL
MDVVTGAIGSLISKLGELLKDEYNLQKNLRKEVESLSLELESAQAALRKVGDVPPEQLEEQVRIWTLEVREASYNMEDVLDIYLVERLEGGHERTDNESFFQRLKEKAGGLLNMMGSLLKRRKIAGTIKNIRQELVDVTERRGRYTIDNIVAPPAARSTIDPRLGAMYKEVSELIGIDKSSDELISKLSSQEGNTSNEKMKIVSVVGVGGLGKTTLAKVVYAKLKPQSSCGAFVPVGRNPDLKKVFRDVLIDLDKEKYMDAKYNILDERQLINELRYFLRSKTYFIVIDDVWQIEYWENIKLALVGNDSGSRIITTTRNRDVASEEIYELRPLSCDNSKKLFYTRLFGVGGKCPANHPAEASEKILKSCGGIPLAIITMASMLVGKSRKYWFDLCNSPGFYRSKGNQQVDDTEWILSLSYYDLPSHLRTCLLYLSVYPDDYEIDKNPLIWKWIAEGFVEKRTGTSLFQQGEEYFNQLMNRSMIQAVELKYSGRVYRCHVHDMVLDLIRELSDTENFVTISNDDEDTSSSRNKVRRLAHHNRMMKQTQQDDHMGMAQVRLLVACSCDIDSWVLHPSFKLLRVLDLEGCRVACEGWQGLKHLGNLLHLRYLGLRETFGIQELPEEIGKLKLLQTLDLVRSDIGVLPLGDVGKLSEVRVLQISGHFKIGILQSELARSLGNLHKLQFLELDNYDFNGDAATREWDRVVLPRHLWHLRLVDIQFRRVPSWISPTHLANLSYLSLLVDDIEEAGLRALGWLPELCYLWLSTSRVAMACITATVASITAGDGFFQKLRYCYVYGCMVQLVVNEDSTSVSFTFGCYKTEDERSRSVPPPSVMPNLQELAFEVPVRALYKHGNGGCDNLGLECLPSLCSVCVVLECKHASADGVEKAEAELRNAAQLHPNWPYIQFSRVNEEYEEVVTGGSF